MGRALGQVPKTGNSCHFYIPKYCELLYLFLRVNIVIRRGEHPLHSTAYV